MLKLMYQTLLEDKLQEADSVTDFSTQFIASEDAEDKFFAAIRDTRFIGFKAGFSAAIALLTEAAV